MSRRVKNRYNLTTYHKRNLVMRMLKRFSLILFLFIFIKPIKADVLGKSINNGLAVAELNVLSEADFPTIKWNKSKIYLLPSTPPTIEPIAGIISKGSGSRISHVQLLCRALGIPNGSVSESEFEALKKFNGQKVLYVALDSKPVFIKPLSEISTRENALVSEYFGNTQIQPIHIPNINEKTISLIDLNQVNRIDSGKTCGPKSANLGFLKSLFPNLVADGFVIPFGIVKSVFDSSGISKEISELNSIDSSNLDLITKKLSLIRNKIKTLEFPLEIAKEIQDRAQALLNANQGAGLFVRSDTNVEDLPKFSGAGLNKTIPNVIKLELIIPTILEVWSSPWSERAFSWRKQYVENPENIYPSVLIMQSVDSKQSGVFATINFDNSSIEDYFVSANEGLGFKVVDGLESPEEWLVHSYMSEGPIQNKMELVNSSYAKTKYELDNINGGIKVSPTTTDEILMPSHLDQIANIIKTIRTNSDFVVPFESEFGITSDGIVKLFQIRPVVMGTSNSLKLILNKFYQPMIQ